MNKLLDAGLGVAVDKIKIRSIGAGDLNLIAAQQLTMLKVKAKPLLSCIYV